MWNINSSCKCIYKQIPGDEYNFSKGKLNGYYLFISIYTLQLIICILVIDKVPVNSSSK